MHYIAKILRPHHHSSVCFKQLTFFLVNKHLLHSHRCLCNFTLGCWAGRAAEARLACAREPLSVWAAILIKFCRHESLAGCLGAPSNAMINLHHTGNLRPDLAPHRSIKYSHEEYCLPAQHIMLLTVCVTIRGA